MNLKALQDLKKNKFNLLFIIIFIFIALVRIHRLGESPPGFYKDEAGITINGYSILKTGKDEFGRFMPLFFENFGDYKEPIFIYSQLPAMLIWGEDIYSTRITSAIWGLATIIAFVYLLKIIFKKNTIIILGTLIIGLLPWHIHFSRIGFQLITLPFFFTLYLIYFYKLSKTLKIKYLNITAILLGLMFYTYYSGRYLGILYLTFQWLMLRKKINYKYFISSGVIFIVTLLPVLIWSEAYPQTIFSRFNTVSIIQTDSSINQIINQYILGYLQHYSFDFWFFKGDGNLRHSVQFHYPIFWTFIPIALSGIYHLIQKRAQVFKKLIIITILTFPLASALTKDAPHIHRIIFMVPVVCYILVLGIISINKWLNKKTQRVKLFTIIIFILLYMLESREYYSYYFNDYKDRAKTWFHVQDINSIHALLKYPKLHILSHYVGEFRLSTYQLVSHMDPKEIQQNKYDVYSEDISNLKNFRRGYYLIERKESQQFTNKLPNAVLIEELEKHNIYKL